MEKPRTNPSAKSGASGAVGRHAARTSSGDGTGRAHSAAPRTGGPAPRRAASGTAGAGRAASGAKRTGQPRSTAAQGASSARRTAPPRKPGRRRKTRLGLKERRLLMIAAVALVAVVAVILALALPSGKREVARPADARVDVSENEAASDAATTQEALPEGETPDAAQPEQDATGEGAPEVAVSDAFANISASDAELIEKYHVLNNTPQTREPLGLPESARVDDAYFDDAIFVGDSVTLKLRQYVLQERRGDSPNLLGKASFLAAQSFGTRNALREISEDSIHPVIGGVKMTLEDAIALSGAKKCYIMLGMNDVGVSGIDKAVSYMGQLLQRIKERNPGIVIFVESATPRLSGTHPTTNQLFAYDVKLYDALQRLNDPDIHFVDVAYVMRDESGKLYPDYCSDKDSMALHFTNAGCREWINYLYTHALA